ncbi:hypothetical protein QCA50_017817 [Cerrena zonata]|uniref:Uncharacterized protein n=1 Tax=Cerrena zonata TaxID=2478898 RepID=A0AAW0FM07_9APHY
MFSGRPSQWKPPRLVSPRSPTQWEKQPHGFQLAHSFLFLYPPSTFPTLSAKVPGTKGTPHLIHSCIWHPYSDPFFLFQKPYKSGKSHQVKQAEDRRQVVMVVRHSYSTYFCFHPQTPIQPLTPPPPKAG